MKQIKHYKILERLGRGGMGEVHKAFDKILEREVAIKIMHPHLLENEQMDARLMQEARAAAKLVHPNIVTIYEVGRSRYGRFIVMEYVEGQSLTKFVAAKKESGPEIAVKVTIQILSGLYCAHSMGILHRDVKPDNVLVTNDDIAKILDFGIAKTTDKAGLTIAGDILGTVEYMAPEQMLGESVDHRCDIYSTGVLLYQLLTRRLPYFGKNAVETLYKIMNDDPVPTSYYNTNVGQELDEIVLKAINKNKEERWESAKAFSKALEAVFRSGIYPAPTLQTSEDDEVLSRLAGGTASNERSGDESSKPHAGFFGRAKELKRLANLAIGPSHGQGHTVILTGVAGVGKSALANQFRNYSEQKGLWVLYGACLYQEGMQAYQPFIDGLQGFLGQEGNSEKEVLRVKNLLNERFPLLDKLLGNCETNLSSFTEVDTTSDRMIQGIYELISLISTMRPVVLIIDDLHWADEASLRLFHYVSRHIVSDHILLIGISRSERHDLQKDGKPAPIVDMLARIRRESNCEQITLYRLSKESTEQLIDQSFLPAMFTEEFYDLIYNETGGNPLFVHETLKQLRQSGAIFLNDGAWYNKQDGLEIAIPRCVEDVFVRRLATLSKQEREVLQVASVIGYKFRPSLLSDVLEIRTIDLLKSLQRVENDLEIISSRENEFRFEHPMLRDLLYKQIPTDLRREYHLMTAAYLEGIHDGESGFSIGELAKHLRIGGEHEKAAPLLYQAAEHLYKVGAFRGASAYYSDFMDSDQRSGNKQSQHTIENGLYLKLGRCYEEGGRWNEGLEPYGKHQAISEENGDTEGQINALERIGRIQAKLGDVDSALKTYQVCIRKAEEHQFVSINGRLYNSLGIIYYQKGRFEDAVQCFEKSMQLIDGEDSEYQKANTLLNLGVIANLRCDYEYALASYEKALEIYELKNDSKNQARVQHNIGFTLADQGHWEKSIDAFNRALELTEHIEDKEIRALIYLNLGSVLAKQGAFSEAEKNAKKALKISKLMGDVLNVAEVYHVIGMIHGLRGNLSEAEIYLQESIDINEQKECVEGLAEIYSTYGELCRHEGEINRAKDFFEKAATAYRKLNLAAKADLTAVKIQELHQHQDQYS